jgi:tRNA U34 5-carboxymethylaminomethyl modifying enzyme MnmG/GidA
MVVTTCIRSAGDIIGCFNIPLAKLIETVPELQIGIDSNVHEEIETWYCYKDLIQAQEAEVRWLRASQDLTVCVEVASMLL